MYEKFKSAVITVAIDRPRLVLTLMLVSTFVVVLMAAAPSLWPDKFSYLHGITIDTDPENMLSDDEPTRLFHNASRTRFDLYDMIVVGIVNDEHPEGVFNPESLRRIHELTDFAKTLKWQGDKGQQGVVSAEMLAPSTVDVISQAGAGAVNFSWLMAGPPESEAEAKSILDKAQRIPFLNGTLVSEDGRAIAIYLPITVKEVSYRVRNELLEFTRDWEAEGDQVYITGLPVAEDTFGVEMFIQMAISAPLAMLVIFGLLWWFFKRLTMVVSPMIIAMVCSLSTMGLLIITGNTIHIMSSMIPIFIMPIAVLDGVHVLSEFFDRYPQYRDRRETIVQVMDTLFAPMLFTTLTTMAGFASLTLTPIPPVQIFGLFIAIGVFLAWVWTILFIPAYIMLISEERLAGYGHQSSGTDQSLLTRALLTTGLLTTRHPKVIVALTIATIGVAGYGISKIVVNDNPTRWFESDHPIRVADRVLNDHFGGTYMAYLELSAAGDPGDIDIPAVLERFEARRAEAGDNGYSAGPYERFMAYMEGEISRTDSSLSDLNAFVSREISGASDDDYYSWDDIQLFLDEERQRDELFKRPQVLSWMEGLQAYLLESERVGKVNGLTDVVKTVYRELQLGDSQAFRIPDSTNAVAQTLITYQNSHRPGDLWHFVTPDFRRSVIWLQLTSGDNRDMESVIDRASDYTRDHGAPEEIAANWFGLTYINVIWQNKMVTGMLQAFVGSFAVVLVMMILLFRSFLWGSLAMIPLAVTVGLIYGIIGFIGKDYDMPVAVLSALSLGLAVDYAIHFLARSRAAAATTGSWSSAVTTVFGEPARAISRNAIILGAGFIPLLAAPLVPYQTVGIFIASIVLTAGIASLLILPALITLMQNSLFKREH